MIMSLLVMEKLAKLNYSSASTLYELNFNTNIRMSILEGYYTL